MSNDPVNRKEDAEYKPEVRVQWTPFEIQNGHLVEASGEYGSDKFPVDFKDHADFVKFLEEDQTPFSYDGWYILLPVVRRATVRR